ncbi:MAG: zinc-ribbon domain-containing protein [Candidatus Obscuribacterales bacterium]|jgi:hypothetical protein
MVSKASKKKNIWVAPVGSSTRPKRFIEDVVHPRFLTRSVALSAANPEIAAEWLYSKNCGWGPEDFPTGSHVVAWFKCSECNHEWQAAIKARTILHSGCPQCNCGETTNLRDYPTALRQFDNKRNKGVDPHMLPQATKVWWQCKAAKDHAWLAAFRRKGKTRCPFCRGAKGSSTNNLTMSSKLAKQFHPTRNGSLKAKDIPLSSKRPVWWQCKRGLDHVWQAIVDDRIRDNSDCPFCTNRKVASTNSLAALFPGVAKEWHSSKNKPDTSDTVIATSHRLTWWRCSKCKHEWQAKVENRTRRNFGCPACAGRVVTKDNSLAARYPKIAREWHPKKNGKITASDVHYGSNKKYWFLCKDCNKSFETRINLRTKMGYGTCPHCR